MARVRIPLLFWQLIAAALGGILAGPALPKAGLWWIIFPSVALIHWSLRTTKRRFGWIVGFVAGFSFYAAQSPWLTTYLGPVPWLALSVLQALIFSVGGFLASLVWHWYGKSEFQRNKWGSVAVSALLAGVWTGREWLSGHWPYGGYQWSRLAQTQADTLLATWAYWLGLSGLSFVVAFSSVLALQLLLTRHWTRKRNWIALALVIAIPAVTVVPTNTTGKSIVVAAVQGNANAGLFANPVPGSILDKHLQVTQRLVEDSEFAQVDLVVWPENASDLDPTSVAAAHTIVRNLADETLQRDFLLGAVTRRGPEVYNSTLMYRPGVGLVDWYDKQRPVPFGEYVPDRDFWYQLAPDLVGLISHGYSFGQRDGIFSTSGTKVGSLICFEIAIDAVLADLVSDGAEIIASQANNSDFGTSEETFQQEALARLQAISTGRAIVHVSTVGVTEFILPNGKVIGRIEPFTPGYTIADLPLNNHLTPSQTFGEWFDGLNLLAVGLATAGILVSRRRFKVKMQPSTDRTA